ncbi:TPA: hypothetical protein R2K55_005196 [Raoultella ornithinolytica]|uniref:hypothetical protein n=1 Tax=Raoultella ornithinolytica TaxID=54291 RepID=UPI00273F48FF|nr:hypothetical protein [Raoultella ornithinolytica]WLP44704.1 hypothetical protein Q7A27_18785 [Raoultella ornithinolytica]HEC2553490.1 hypothetical protein [Raoultella ornithinolytica]HEC2606186.1 hypothetical protein [Raoultella ornithinolytica]
MSDMTVQQAAEKAYRAEIILALICEKSVVHMEDSEVDALLVMVKKLVGDVGGFLGEEESLAEVENV